MAVRFHVAYKQQPDQTWAQQGCGQKSFPPQTTVTAIPRHLPPLATQKAPSHAPPSVSKHKPQQASTAI